MTTSRPKVSLMLLAVCWALCQLGGCGGGSSSPPPPPPVPISVSLSPTTAMVEAGATANFTAGVMNDPSNMGVKWSVSCGAPQCGVVLPAATASGAFATYTAPPQPPGSDLTVTVIATSLADATKTASASVTVPAIAVSVSPGTATVQAGAALHNVSATVANDPSNSGVTWNVSCSVANCGTVSPNATPNGGATTYTAPSPLPTGGANISVTATSTTDTSKSSSVTLVPVEYIQGYDVGVDYHAFGADFDSTAFITIYNQPTVRQTVQTQLQGMADRGATVIQTAIWFVTEPGTTNFGQAWRATFPMADQEAANLQQYAQDVAAVQGSGGNRLRLILALNWLGAADFTIGSPTTGLGYSNLSAAEYISRIKTTTDKVLGAVSGVARPDGVPVVSRVFLDCGVTIPAPGEPNGNANEGWFLTANYPRFVNVVSQAGIEPSVYFNVDFSQAAILDDTYVDSVYSALNGHRSMFWPYRGMKFMVDNGLPLPKEIEFAWYMSSTGATYEQLVQRILADADATLPSLGAPQIYGAAETYYFSDPTLCFEYGQAFATQAAQNPELRRVSFWTTPDGGGTGVNIAYPFAIEDFLPRPSN